MIVRRLTEADAGKAASWLKKLYQDDPESGGNPDIVSSDSIEMWAERELTWVCVEGSSSLGIIHSAGQGIMLEGDKLSTFTLFTILAVDFGLYSASKEQAIEVSKQLTLAAMNDLRDSGRMTDFIRVIGPKDSRGASWTRDYLKFEEIPTKGNYGEWRLPFNLIWERIEAVKSG